MTDSKMPPTPHIFIPGTASAQPVMWFLKHMVVSFLEFGLFFCLSPASPLPVFSLEQSEGLATTLFFNYIPAYKA
jgi:hypothetical protein